MKRNRPLTPKAVRQTIARPAALRAIKQAKPRGQIQRFTSFAAAKDEEYAYWQSRPVYERLAAASELSIEGHRLKGALPRESGLRGHTFTPQL